MQSDDETLEISDTEADTSKQENKGKPMTKAETLTLLDLISKSHFLHCKSGTTAVNELKTQEWQNISELFNSKTKTPRSTKQLKLKWENMKKFARQPANRLKPLYAIIGHQILNLINHPKPFDESQINKKLTLEIDNFSETSETIISDDLNVEKTQTGEVNTHMMKSKKAKATMKPMTNNETFMLLDLIAKSQILFCKSGTAATNELKIQEWQRICNLFNSRTKTKRNPKQLRMKWENLKKYARLNANKSKQHSIPRVNDVIARVLDIINNPKQFNASQINIEHYDLPEIDFWRSNTNNKMLEMNNSKSQEKGKSMNYYETNILLDLIESSLIFNSAETFPNKVKRIEWCRICNEFNNTKGVSEARTPKQLCLRWDNLKKASRRQTFTFRPDYIIERVRAIQKNRQKSIEQNVSDDDNIYTDVNCDETSFSDTEIKTEFNTVISEDSESPTKDITNSNEKESTDRVKMSKEDTNILLDLIEESQILHRKDINPHTNEIKLKEWDRISNEFNTIVDTGQHTAEQLQSKWEHLKACARERIAFLETNGKSPVEAPDSILDRVSLILEKFERNESDCLVANEEDPLDTSNRITIKVKSEEQDVDEDDTLDHKQEAKQREWRQIARRFNAIALPKVPKISRQLFMKWESLKRQARRRNAVMNSQIRNGKHDNILDNVSSILVNETQSTIVTRSLIPRLNPKKPEIDKAKPMTDKEAETLIDIIERSKIIRGYKNASVIDKLNEWHRITKQFNSAKSTRINRNWRQLRLKWENMKKAARKHIAKVAREANNYYYTAQPNETIKRVINILQANKKGKIEKCDKSTYPDPEIETKHTTDSNIYFKREHLNTFLEIVESEIQNINLALDDPSQLSPGWYIISERFSAHIGVRKTAEQMREVWNVLNKDANNMSKNEQKPTKIPQDILQRVSTILHKYSTVTNKTAFQDTVTEAPQNIVFKTEFVCEPIEGSLSGNNYMEEIQDVKDCTKAKKDISHQESKLSRNMAIAEYFIVKKKIAEAKLNRILLENEKLKLEIDLLKNRNEPNP